ncbi:MAG: M28 family peptidase [Vicinamibacterales bacterium]
MSRRILILSCIVVLAGAIVASAQMTPWLQWTFLPPTIMAEIVGEASGENAWKMIMETGGYDKDRAATEFDDIFYETRFYLNKLKEYQFSGAELVKYPGGSSWDASEGELWEVSPIRQKLASYRDLAVMLATGSVTGEATGELVWVGLGRAEDLKDKDLTGKIVVTDGSVGSVHSIACGQMGAAGVVGIASSRELFDPLQLPWATVGGRGGAGRGGQAPGAGAPATPPPTRFGFQIPPREGDYLKRRLLAGEKITVHAKVVAEMRNATLQDLVWHIPGTDPNAGEIIFSAHLFEGFVKQGGNDDISGCASLVEIARTLKALIDQGRIPKPKRTIRFIIGPEFSGTGPWVTANKALMEKTLCNINLDMVGLLLSRSQSFMCMIRTTYGNPHYINDVMENYYRFVGEGNRERIQLRSSFYPVPQRIVAPSGADEPFYYSIETHYGASDHEVFNDWGVQVPGVMMITWPDRWYHTSGDHVDKTDPTQLKRIAIIGAAAAYTIANADDAMAAKIASETASNGTQRLGHQMVRGLEALNQATAAGLADAYKAARSYLEAAIINEKNTLESVNELAVDKKAVADHVAAMQKVVDQVGQSQLAALEAHMKATARRLNVPPVTLQLTELEQAAAKMVPKPTPLVTANGYQGYRAAINNVPAEVSARLPFNQAGDTAELSRLCNGRNSVLDIKKALDAQSSRGASDLQHVMNYVEILKAAGLVEVPPPAPTKAKTR